VTISDCVVDFTTPFDFRTGSVNIGFGEIRVTSNVLFPPGPIQNVNVSLSDIGLYISNERISFKVENNHILCSHLFAYGITVLNPLSRVVVHSFEEVMGRMNFVAVLNIDSVDILVTIKIHSPDRSETKSPSTVSLSIGRVSLYTCRDSFRCLMDTVGELFLVMTSPETKIIVPKYGPSSKADSTSKTTTVSIKDAMDDTLFHEIQDGGEGATKCLFEQVSVHDSNDFQTLHSDCSWTAIDYRWSRDHGLHEGMDQSTRWYQDSEPHASTMIPENATVIVDATSLRRESFKIFPQHISHSSSSQSLRGTEAHISELLGKTESLGIKLRILINDMTLVGRFFDGFDWSQAPKCDQKIVDDAKKILLDGLLTHDEDDMNRNDRLHSNTQIFSRKRRQTDKFFQVQITGLKTRFELFNQFNEHSLKSFMSLTLGDFLLAERLSSKKPLKVIAEWISDKEHPRDSNDGIIMLTVSSNVTPYFVALMFAPFNAFS
jgi:hypothetical protein